MYTGCPVKYLLSLSDFNETCIFFDRFSKKIQISNFIKIHPVGAELFHVDRHDKANSCFLQFFEHAKNDKSLTTVIEKYTNILIPRYVTIKQSIYTKQLVTVI
jgi:S-adenosylmethionine:tRNA-ribosyltransferase-isomerase (queuine synthetase)